MNSRYIILMVSLLIVVYASTSPLQVHAKFSGVSCVRPIGSLYCFWDNQGISSDINQAQPASIRDRLAQYSSLDQTALAELGILTIAGIVLGLVAVARWRRGQEFEGV